MDPVAKLTLSISAIRSRKDLLETIQYPLKDIFSFCGISIMLLNEDDRTQSNFIHYCGVTGVVKEHFADARHARYAVEDGFFDRTMRSDLPVLWNLTELMAAGKLPEYVRAATGEGMCWAMGIPLRAGKKQLGCLFFLSKSAFDVPSGSAGDLDLIGTILSIAIANILANEKIEHQFEEITAYKQQLENEKLYLQEEIETTHNYGEIVGSGPGMRKVFQLVSQVAGTATSVLLMGETGTGKELIARALHNSSMRREKLMVKVNCATLPANLIESELFGHERGSFTGAMDRRIGKFELANNSTLFLDEVGELPMELQAKLLRALQEKEIERVGGSAVIKTDVRVIAATNRDLIKEVQAGNFRSDLYYRLNVFPILIPPLRQRREDIAGLATHFLHKHSKKGKGVMNFSSRVLKELTAYNWPGNVRELEHMIERSILSTNGSTINMIHLPVTEREEMRRMLPDAHIKTIAEVERDHIIAVLRICNGKVAGIGGAAEKLQIPSTTLTSKIRRLKIRKGYLDE